MDKVISCEFNIDTACVEVKYADGSMISIDCTRVENEIARNMYEASELEWLEKCGGQGRIGPQIVLPDVAYEQLMELDAVRQARETVKRLEGNN